MSAAKPRVYRFGWYDAAGKVQEADATYTDHRQMMDALGPECEARQKAGLPQISAIHVYELCMVAPVVILLDEAPIQRTGGTP